MILSPLCDADVYAALGDGFRKAFEYLKRTDLAALEAGRVDVDGPGGESVFALPQVITTKPPEQCRWEAHRKYADIQYVVSGVERMGVGPRTLFDVETAHDPAKDVGFFKPASADALGQTSLVVVPEGFFTIFMPSDVHMPLVWSGSPATVKKVVMKVRVG